MATLLPALMDPRVAAGFQVGDQFYQQFVPFNSGAGSAVQVIVPGTDVTVTGGDPTHPILSIPPNTFVKTVVAGTNVTVDSTDPEHPIVNATTGGGGGNVQSVTGTGAGISVDNTDPTNPIIHNTGVTSIVAGANIGISGATGAVTLTTTASGTFPDFVGVIAQQDGTAYDHFVSTSIRHWTTIASGGTGWVNTTGIYTPPTAGAYHVEWNIFTAGTPLDVFFDDGVQQWGSAYERVTINGTQYTCFRGSIDVHLSVACSLKGGTVNFTPLTTVGGHAVSFLTIQECS